MAITMLGANGTRAIAGGAGASSFTITTTADISLVNSRWCIIDVTSDNRTTTEGETNDHTSITGGNGTWTKLGEFTNANGAAGAGVTKSAWMFVPNGENLTGTVFTINLSGNVTDACAALRRFTWDSTKGLRLATAAVGNGVDASNGFGSATISGLSSKEYLFYRVLGKEANSTTALTASTNFTAGTVLRSRNNAAAVLLRQEFRIAVSTGETSNPTMAVSGDTAGLFLAIEEYDLSITGTAAVDFGITANSSGQAQAKAIGSAAIGITAAGSGEALAAATGAASVGFTATASGEIVTTANLTGQASIGITAQGSVALQIAAAATVQVEIAASATGQALVAAIGSAQFAIAAAGEGASLASAASSAIFAITASAVGAALLEGVGTVEIGFGLAAAGSGELPTSSGSATVGIGFAATATGESLAQGNGLPTFGIGAFGQAAALAQADGSCSFGIAAAGEADAKAIGNFTAVFLISSAARAGRALVPLAGRLIATDVARLSFTPHDAKIRLAVRAFAPRSRR